MRAFQPSIFRVVCDVGFCESALVSAPATVATIITITICHNPNLAAILRCLFTELGRDVDKLYLLTAKTMNEMASTGNREIKRIVVRTIASRSRQSAILL
jgi:hypothetical protein